MTDSGAALIKERDDEGLLLPDAAAFADPLQTLDHILELVQAYPGLQGPHAGADGVLRHKLAHAFWRKRMVSRLIEALPAAKACKQREVLHVLGALRTAIHPRLLGRIEQTVDTEAFSELLISQGIRSNRPRGREAGPQIDIDMKANRSSPWSFSKWSRLEEFSRYHFEDDGIHYRGLKLRPGDVLLSNCNIDGNGIYTTLGDPKSYTSHAALFAILNRAGRRFPVAVETFEKGVRPVPLSVFLSRRFAAYTEVYRHTDLATEHTDRINQAASRMIREVKGYNFDACDSARDYLSCTAVPRFALQDAGLEPGTTKSRIRDAGIQKNLLRLGYDFFDFSSPIDFVMSDEYRCVGWVDNNQTARLVARELVEVRFRQLFSRGDIIPSRYPTRYWINRWGIRQMRRRSLLGRVISAVEGFDHQSLPKGPDALLALIKPAEQQVGRAITEVYPAVSAKLQGLSRLDLKQLHSDDEIQSGVKMRLNIPWLSETCANRVETSSDIAR